MLSQGISFKKKVSDITYLFLCLIFPGVTIASNVPWALSEKEKDAYKHIISLRLEEASPLLSQDRPGSLYLTNLSQAIELIISENRSFLPDFKKKFDDRQSKIKNYKGHNPHKNFYRAEMYLHSALVHLKLGNEWTAIWDFKRAYKLINKNTALYPGFLPNYKSLGMLHIMIGSVPESYHWVIGLLGFEGSVQQGLGEMKKITDSDHLFKEEATALYHLLEAYLFNNSETAVDNFRHIYRQNPDNLLFGYLYMALLIKNSQGADALQIFHHLETLKKGYIPFYFLHYMAGEIYLQKGDYLTARNYLTSFINNARGVNFLKDAHYKLFLAYWLQGHEKKALQAYKKAQLAGITDVEADKHAAKSLMQPILPNKLIMKLRLLTDGGFYEEAKKLLLQDFIFHSKKDRVELSYRKARLYHKMERIDDAARLYLKTINDAIGERWYFAPNACLQLGYIYREKGDNSRAQYYFNQVLTYKSHEYKTSLDNKAKAAIAAYEQ